MDLGNLCDAIWQHALADADALRSEAAIPPDGVAASFRTNCRMTPCGGGGIRTNSVALA